MLCGVETMKPMLRNAGRGEGHEDGNGASGSGPGRCGGRAVSDGLARPGVIAWAGLALLYGKVRPGRWQVGWQRLGRKGR
jgi:hypothetical protein